MLAGWATTPARFREDANAEQDAATGGYADRLVIELAQNAADAAGSSPGRLLLRWDADGLLAANSGEGLTEEGVLGLSTLRASAKTGTASVGRFGVGFAAVLAVTDDPRIGSRGMPSVRWSAADTLRVAGDLPALQADLAARGEHVPVLRLPFEAAPLDIPEGYDTAVWLPWRDGAAAKLGAALLDSIEPTLLLTLPGLAQIRIDRPGKSDTTTCSWSVSGALLDGRRWHRVTRSGPVSDSLLENRPAEERDRRMWTVSAFAPADQGGLPAGTAGVLRAPTPTDEPMSLPVVLVASVPLEPTRRRVVRGALADMVLDAAGRTIAELAATVADPFPLVPTGLAAGDLDAVVRTSLLDEIRRTPLFSGVLPADCVVLDLGDATAETAALIGSDLPGLLPAAWSSPSRAAAVTALGIRRIDTAGVVEFLSQLDREPAFWRRVYGALAQAPDRDALGALPVPLVDGRVVTGARGALLPTAALPPDVAALPVRLVHPDAVHPLLERLGARPSDAGALLSDPAVRQAVESSLDEETSDDLAKAVAALVAASDFRVEEHPWLAALALPAVGGGREAAGDLIWPGGRMAKLVDPDAGFGTLDRPPWLERDIATRLGVCDAPALFRLRDVPLDRDLDDGLGLADLPDVGRWIEFVTASMPDQLLVAHEVTAIRDLEDIGDLAALLRDIADDPGLRAAVVDPVVIGGERRVSYTAWWLSQQAIFAGLRPLDCVLPGTDLLSGLYDPAPAGYDPQLLTAIGVRRDLADVVDNVADLADLLDRLGDRDRTPARQDVLRIHAAVAGAWRDRLDEVPDPPLAVRAVTGQGDLVVASPERCVIVDSPDLLPLVFAAGYAVVPVPFGAAPVLAEVLDLVLASELSWPKMPPGFPTPIGDALAQLAPGGPRTYQLHEELDVPWRFVDGVLHSTPAGLASGLAWAAGCWPRRYLLKAVLEHPQDLATVLLEAELGDES